MRPERFRSGAPSVTLTRRRTTRDAPCSRSRQGRTNNSNVTWVETGFPGRPNTSVRPQRPNTSGAPGLIATCVKKKLAPSASSAGSTRS